MENSIKLIPTEGCYQKPIDAQLVRETKRYYIVTSESFMGEWKFSKQDCFRTDNYKNEFPKWRIEL